jgi:polysaccharide deacetylase 2 family uncharacterized protein YibQ
MALTRADSNLMAPSSHTTTAKKKNVQKVTTDFFADWDNDEPAVEEELEPSPVQQRREEEDAYVRSIDFALYGHR